MKEAEGEKQVQKNDEGTEDEEKKEPRPLPHERKGKEEVREKGIGGKKRRREPYGT